METWPIHHLTAESEEFLGPEAAAALRTYAQPLISRGLPVIFTLKHLANIVGVDYNFLRATVNRDREFANYRTYRVKKRSGGHRIIHALCNDLQATQRFLNTELLQKVHVHPNSFAFHPRGGIRNCAAVHCGARWIFQFDLDNFFHRINEIDVYKVFHSLGYRPLLAMELSRICTTIYLLGAMPAFIRRSSYIEEHYKFYDWPGRILGVLPQGGPTSPMLSNLVAHRLDERLEAFAMAYGFAVTRYADDLTISSAKSLPPGMSVAKIKRSVIQIIQQCGFRENPQKIRVAGPGSRKIVLGLLVDGNIPRISRETYKRVDRLMHASLKYGIAGVASHEGFDSPIGFYNHLQGLVNFVIDVDTGRGNEFKMRFSQIPVPWTLP